MGATIRTMGKRIIVTGAAGFIGRNVLKELNQRGYANILLVDSLGVHEKWKNLLGLRFEDIISPLEFLEVIKSGKSMDAEICIHLGACSDTTQHDADYLLENNFHYTVSLCKWSVSYNMRFVYASSAATYGNGSLGYNDSDEITQKLRPLNMYGYSKHMFDLWALKNDLFNTITGLKYFNVYGPYEDHKGDMRSLVQKSYNKVKTLGYIELFKSYHDAFKDGEQKRDFIYIRDAVNVTLYFALESNAGGLFNCGTGHARTWLDLAHAVFDSMGRSPDVRFIEMPDVLRDKYQYFTQADTAKLIGAGYNKPFTSLSDGVDDYVKSYLETVS